MSCPVCHNQYISCMEPDGMCQGCYDKAHPVEAEIRISAKKKKEQEKKALLKKLRDAENERQRKAYELWKLKQSCKTLSYKEWKAKKIADGTWDEQKERAKAWKKEQDKGWT